MRSKSLINTLLTVAGLLIAATFAPSTFAQTATQDQPAPPSDSQPSTEKHQHGEEMFAGLNLTDDQRAQIKKIHQDAKAKADAVKADTGLSDTDKQAKVKGIHHAAMMQARQVLTPEQREQLKEKMQERRAQTSHSPSM
jgi:Spy/CpxP family protein refolding chaperone